MLFNQQRDDATLLLEPHVSSHASLSSHLACFYTFDRNNRATQVIQRIDDTNERGLVSQYTCQDCHRILLQHNSVFDRHATDNNRTTSCPAYPGY